MLRANTRLRLVVWSLVAALSVQCVFVWRVIRSLDRRVADRARDVEQRLVAAYAVACSNAVTVLSSVRLSPSASDDTPADAAPSAPRVVVVGRGTNGLYDYVDVSIVDDYGIESVRRCYSPARNPDRRSVSERRPPGY